MFYRSLTLKGVVAVGLTITRAVLTLPDEEV